MKRHVSLLAATSIAMTAWAWVLLQLETQLWRPGYAAGDEVWEIWRVLKLLNGEPHAWRWGQGQIHRALLGLLAELSGRRMEALHLLGSVSFLLEAALLFGVAKRWWGARAAAWAVLVLSVNANTWLRERSILTFQWAPLLVLALAYGSRYVQGLGSAILWAVGLAAVSSEYEALALVAPFLVMACAEREDAFSKRAWSIALLWLALTVCAILLQADQGQGYAKTRYLMSVQGSAQSSFFKAVFENWRGLLLGGEPRPSMGIAGWPAWPPWAALGLLTAAIYFWKLKNLAWGLFVFVVPLALLGSNNPHGLPSHRLAVVAPALALASGLGLAMLFQGRHSRSLGLLLLVLGCLSEGAVWTRHMVRQGDSTWGRAEDLSRAARHIQEHARPQDAVLSAWAGLHCLDLEWHVRSKLPPRPERAWFLAPLGLRQALQGEQSVKAEIFQTSPASEPTWLVLAEGPLAKRIIAVEEALRPWVGPGISQEARRDWLREQRGKVDPWAWAAVLEAYRGPLPGGPEGPQEYYRWAQEVLPVTPGPLNWLAFTYLEPAPIYTLDLASQVIAVHPDYSPALFMRMRSLERLGRPEEALQAKELWQERTRQGAWPIYDRP